MWLVAAKVTLAFRGTSITWQGGRGPEGGIASVQVDGGAPTEVDTYAPAQKYQEVLFTATGLADANHTLTTPFDIVVSGKVAGLGCAQQQDKLLPRHEAGLTWWIEDMIGEPEEQVIAYLNGGPPRLE